MSEWKEFKRKEKVKAKAKGLYQGEGDVRFGRLTAFRSKVQQSLLDDSEPNFKLSNRETQRNRTWAFPLLGLRQVLNVHFQDFGLPPSL